MSRIFYDKNQNRLIVLSYAGGTKFFTPLAATLGYTHLESVNNPGKPNYILQVVREPIQRWMSWFDKQYVKDLFQKTRMKNRYFYSWCTKNINKKFIDDYFSTAYYKIHYDGHTAYQCYWPKIYLKRFDTEWKYLQMENINPYFLNQKPYKPKRTKKEYIGLWEAMDNDLKEYTLSKANQIYAQDIEWYHNLDFIDLSKKD
jgi:hypothetical protein